MVPKAEQPATLGGIAEALRRINPHGVLVAIIESAIGLHQADAIATAPGVARLAFGSIDYAVDLGCEHTRDALAYARSRLVLASRVARLPPPVDGVTTALTDETVLADDVAYAGNSASPASCVSTRRRWPACKRASVRPRNRPIGPGA